MEEVNGPTYDLHPTVWGLTVEDPDYYAQRCFDYIVTSSMISKRYHSGYRSGTFSQERAIL